MNKLGPVNLPQDYRTDYDKRLSVMLYEYLRRLSAHINYLLENGMDLPIGTNLVADSVSVTEAPDQPETVRDRVSNDLLLAILAELRVMNMQMNMQMNNGNLFSDEPAGLAGDPDILAN